MLIIEIELSFGSQIYPKPTPFVQSVLWFCKFYRQSVATQSIDLLQPNALRCESCLFFAIFVLKCAKVVVSSVWLQSHRQFVCYRLPCRWARTFIFFSTDSISDFRCESLGSFTFFVSCLVLSRSNARELDRLYYFAFSNDSLDFTLDLFESFNKCATSVGHEIY